MILNTGNRTDIPAFYKEWFYQRIKEGYVLTRNPYNPQNISKYMLNPDVIDVISFCTKNPRPMIERLEEIKKYRQLWQVTITPYGKDIEPFLPSKDKILDAFCDLSKKVGENHLFWRYDPIILTKKYTKEKHITAFKEMATRLKGSTKVCIISFLDLYEKTKRNYPKAKEVSIQDQKDLVAVFVKIAKENGMRIFACMEADWLKAYGVNTEGCMTKNVLEKVFDITLDIPKEENLKTRRGCNCLLGHDIGMYNSCRHGCLYCYANDDRKIVDMNQRLHDPYSPLLIGYVRAEDIIKQVKQKSYLQSQIRLPFC